MTWPGLLQLWPLAMIFAADHSDFIPGKTPLATRQEIATTISLYYTLVFSGRHLMRTRRAFNLQTLFMVHNLSLTLISAALLSLFAQELVPIIRKHGLFYCICGPGGWTKQLASLYYVRFGKHHDQVESLTTTR